MALTYVKKPELLQKDVLRLSGSMYGQLQSCEAQWLAKFIWKVTEDENDVAKTGSYFVVGHGLHAGVETYLEALMAAKKARKKRFKSTHVEAGVASFLEEVNRLGGTEAIDWPGNWGPLAGTLDELLTKALAEEGITFSKKTDVGKVRRAMDGWTVWMPKNVGVADDGTTKLVELEDGELDESPFAAGETGVDQLDTLDAEARKQLLYRLWLRIWNGLDLPQGWSVPSRLNTSIDGFYAMQRFADWTAYLLSQFPEMFIQLDVTPVAIEFDMAPFDPEKMTGVQVPDSVNLWLTGTADLLARCNKTGKLVMIDWKTAADLLGYMVPGFATRSMQLSHYSFMAESILRDKKHDLHKEAKSYGMKPSDEVGFVQYVLFQKKPMPAGWSRDELELPKDYPVTPPKPKKGKDEDDDGKSSLPTIAIAPREENTQEMRDAFLKRVLEIEADQRDPDRMVVPSAAGAYNSPCAKCPVAHWCFTGDESKLKAVTYNISSDDDEEEL